MNNQQVIKRSANISSVAKKEKDQTAFKTAGRFDFRPTSIEEAIQLAEIMAATDMVPDQFKNKPGDILVAMQLGDSVGLTPMQAVQGIAVINGRPSIWGDAALAVVHASGLLENIKEMTFDEIVAAKRAVFWAKRRGIDEPFVRQFSMEDAQRAGLMKKQIYSQYWPRMFQMRARGFGLRDGFADVLKGLAIAEEQNDIIDVNATEVREAPKVLAVPRRLSDRTEVDVNAGRADVSYPARENPPHPADSGDRQTRDVSQPSGKIEPTCEKCGGRMKLVPEGIAKQGKNKGQKYPAFWICDKDKYSKKDSDWKNELQQRMRFSDQEPEPGPDVGVQAEREPGQEG